MEPRPPAVEAGSLSHWASREAPRGPQRSAERPVGQPGPFIPLLAWISERRGCWAECLAEEQTESGLPVNCGL